MKNFFEDHRFKILILLGSSVLVTIVLVFLFGFDIATVERKEKIGFIVLGDINEDGWSSSHYNGIKAASKDFGVELLVREKIPENSGKCRQAVEELISQGAGMIMLASFNYPSEVQDLIEKYPNIAFVATSTNERAKNLTVYFAKMFQGRYLAGALAGMKTKTNSIGYVAAMKNDEVCRGINAFTLGVQSTNPNAKVFVIWTGSWENYDVEQKNAKKLVKEKNADILTYHQDDKAVPDIADSLGVDFIGYNANLQGYSENHLCTITCRWDFLYKDMIQKYLKGELRAIRINWLGVPQNVIDLTDYSSKITPEIILQVQKIKNDLENEKIIFRDEIYDNQGNLRCLADEVISDEELLNNVDWLVKGVEVIN